MFRVFAPPLFILDLIGKTEKQNIIIAAVFLIYDLWFLPDNIDYNDLYLIYKTFFEFLNKSKGAIK